MRGTASSSSSGPPESLQQMMGTASSSQYDRVSSSSELRVFENDLNEKSEHDKFGNHVGQSVENQNNIQHTYNTAAAAANSDEWQHVDEATLSQKVFEDSMGEGGEGKGYLMALASRPPTLDSTTLSSSKYLNRHVARGDVSGDLVNRTINIAQERVEPVQLFQHEYRNGQLFVIKKQQQQ